MKERPILFSGPMVRAILTGTKTQTRRVVKQQIVQDERFIGGFKLIGPGGVETAIGGPLASFQSPYGSPGDRLWVRETWYCDDYRVQRGPYLKPDKMDMDEMMVYRASSGHRPFEAEQPVWRPAIHMPRWASRITLEITGVRVERLQDISEADATAEGIDFLRHVPDVDETLTTKQLYECLWRSINGPGSWAANPWVWVIEFKRIQGGAA